MITAYFHRDTKDEDLPTASRDALNQFIFERLAEALGISLQRSSSANMLAITNEDDLGEEMTHTFIHELAAYDIIGLVITYQTSKERAFLRTISEVRYFHPVSEKVFRRANGSYSLRNKLV